jgi:hypothetical protein
MALVRSTMHELQRYLHGGVGIDYLQRRVRATLSVMDGTFPLELRDLLEGFVHDLEEAKTTSSGDEQRLHSIELAVSVEHRLRPFAE